VGYILASGSLSFHSDCLSSLAEANISQSSIFSQPFIQVISEASRIISFFLCSNFVIWVILLSCFAFSKESSKTIASFLSLSSFAFLNLINFSFLYHIFHSLEYAKKYKLSIHSKAISVFHELIFLIATS
jgi:hypothetical protein